MKSTEQSTDESQRRTHIMLFRVSEDEKIFIEKKAELSGCKNLSSYLRKSAITANIIRYTGEDLKALRRDTAGLKNNINQITRRVNATSVIYSEDIEEIKSKVDDIWQQLLFIQSALQLTKP